MRISARSSRRPNRKAAARLQRPARSSTRRAVRRSSPTRRRGFEITQRNFTGNADFTLTNTTFLSVKAGTFYDNYSDTGVHNHDRTATERPPPESQVPLASLQCGVLASEHARASASTTSTRRQAVVFQADYNAAFNAGGFHHLRSASASAATATMSISAIRWLGRRVLGQHVHEQRAWRRVGPRHLRLLRGPRRRHVR